MSTFGAIIKDRVDAVEFHPALHRCLSAAFIAIGADDATQNEAQEKTGQHAGGARQNGEVDHDQVGPSRRWTGGKVHDRHRQLRNSDTARLGILTKVK